MYRKGRRMEKESHSSELNTEKPHTTNVCNHNHIPRDQKTYKLRPPKNLQIATRIEDKKKRKLAILKIKTGVKSYPGNSAETQECIWMLVFPAMFSHNQKQSYPSTNNIELFGFVFWRKHASRIKRSKYEMMRCKKMFRFGILVF